MKITLEIEDSIYTLETNDAEKIKTFVNDCIENELELKKVIDELKHW